MAFPHSACDFSAHHTKKSVGGEEVRWIKHYSSSHKILLVGEGDFSFAASLAAAFGSASNLTATSLEYKKDLKKAYKKAVDNIQELRSKGCNVWHGVDATVMASHPCLKNLVFDRIVFNFPFVVLPKEKRANLHHQTVLKKQQSLVVKFLENVKKMIGENGEIHIIHRTDGFFGAWRIKFLALKHGFELVEASDFHIRDYALYNAKWGNGSDDNFESGPSKTYKFRLPRPPLKPDSFSRPTLPSLQDMSMSPATNSNACQELPSLSLFPNMKHGDVVESLVTEEKMIKKHYSSSHKILLVGEGDFSFAASLAAAFGSASNLTATSLEYKRDLKKAFKKAIDNIQELQSKGCNVWHGVDATVMASHPCLKNMVFDRIVFNFPFAVLPKEKRGNLHHQTVLKKQQSLVVKFLENGKKMIGKNGEIHITHRTDGFFGAWRIKFLASKHGFELVEASDFHISDYALYNAKWGNGSDENFESYPSKTYKFRLPSPPLKPDSFSRPTLPSLQDVSISPASNSNACQELYLSLFPNAKHDDVVESSVAEEKLIKKHYSSSQKILLVGEGDFSFGTSLVAAFGCASNLTATSLEHKRDLKKVYGKAVGNIQVLRSNGCKVWHAVDATVMASHPSLKNLVFDRIIFNFPFAVLSKQEWSLLHLETVLEKQRSLVENFLENAKRMIGEKGEIHITHRKDGIFGAWRIKFLASKLGLQLVGAIDFNICDFPGYNPKWGNGSDDNLESFPSKTYMFRLPHPPLKANSFSSKSTNQDVPIISPTKIYPEEFYAFCENSSHAHQELPSPSVSSGMNILACGASSRNTCSSHDNNNPMGLNKGSQEFCVEELKSILMQQKGNTSPPKSSSFVSHDSAEENWVNKYKVSQEFSVEELKSILMQQKGNTSPPKCSSFISHDSAEEKWVNKYSSSHKILLVGEGDFSFSASLAAAFGSGVNIIATSLDSKKTVKREYDKAAHNISMLKANGCKVLHSVDATAMASHPSLKGLAFDRIVFNFPFAVVPKDRIHHQIREHRSLVEKFLENSKQMITKSGEVHITHRTDGCFGAWRIKFLGTNQGLELVEAKKFNISDYPGYNPRWEIGSSGDVMCMHSKTYMFRLPRRPFKTVSCSSSPTEPSHISVEDVSILEPTNNDLGAELSVEFNSGFAKNWANAHGKLTTPSLLFPKSNVFFGAESHNVVQEEVSASSCAKFLGASRCGRTEATSPFPSTGYQLKQEDTWQDNSFVAEEKCAKHCSSSHRMVLVGEGDSSFSASLAAGFGSASNRTSTCIDSKRVLNEQYERAVYHIEELKRSGCKVMHGVDATAASNPKETAAAAYSMFENDELYIPPMMFPYEGEATPSSVYAAPTLPHFLLPSKYLGIEEKWIKHYSSHQKILLVGEGDFSFSACLAVAFGSAANMTATSLDSNDFLTTNYCKAFLHLRELKDKGCKVMHGIDATCMIYNPCLMGSTFDRIVFNFPYAGFFKDIPRTSQLCCHQYLIRLFLHNAKQMLSGAEGEIHITHKTNGFHKEWNIVCIAVQEGLELVATVDFDAGDYPGYSNKYGFGGDNAFNCSPSQTYIFRLPPPPAFMPWPWP
ncbi:unnamed protein product [Cuscuta europaea]|uniref:25S rRNA (uridine-N(3))-methyltransferase BMT5-like domain-containing protein n=1 Tax=Cuscuta europaea TaxID=41803 RepID=A0A9P0Z039_CUSEU|nr:unnamed protein product [Cuscuta europaea]